MTTIHTPCSHVSIAGTCFSNFKAVLFGEPLSFCNTVDGVYPNVLLRGSWHCGDILCMRRQYCPPWCGIHALNFEALSIVKSRRSALAYIRYITDVSVLCRTSLLAWPCRQNVKSKINNVSVVSFLTERWRFHSAGSLTRCLGLRRDLLKKSSSWAVWRRALVFWRGLFPRLEWWFVLQSCTVVKKRCG